MSLLVDLQPMLHPLIGGIDYLDPDWLLDRFGGAFIWVSCIIVFIECGLFFPFLPGDTLLFALGLFIAGGDYQVFGIDSKALGLLVAMSMLSASAFLGNVVGYEIGRKIGPPLYERDGRIMKRKYLDQTSAFFDKHGNKALVIGRFIPFVRTYITVVAGVTQMERRRFLTWSAVGAVAWVVSITMLGFFLGQTFPALGQNIDYAVIAIMLFSVIPIAYEWRKHRKSGAKRAPRASDATVSGAERAQRASDAAVVEEGAPRPSRDQVTDAPGPTTTG